MGKAPKTRDSSATKARILAAAQEAFAEHGYASVGIREIAGRAGVASSLLVRYFGSKVALYEQALIDSLYNRGQFTRDKENFGEAMVHLMAVQADKDLTAMLVLAAGDPEAQVVARRVAKEHMINTLAQWLGPPDGEARALSMLSVMTGFVIYNHLLETGPPSPEVSRWLAQTLQALVTPAGVA